MDAVDRLTVIDAVVVRPARATDLPAIVRLYADDELHVPREPTCEVRDEHRRALELIQQDPNNQVYVAEVSGQVVGSLQLTFIRQLSYGGCLVAQLESVHVHSAARSRGVGKVMLEWATAEARRRGALRVQLTSNERRTRAHRFYERHGFRSSHRGMKLYLEQALAGTTADD